MSLSSQSMALEEAGPMGGTAYWLIPLIAFALLFLAAGDDGLRKKPGPRPI